MSCYYEDLSGDSDSSSSSSDSDNNDDDGFFLLDDKDDPTAKSTDNNRIILHCDVDCFYCQCEMIDRNMLHNNHNNNDDDRPMAVAQKHIIVTCNYAARRLGIRKLQSREAAQRAVPDMLIVDGSDLERYRSHARAIYTSFRRACRRRLQVLHKNTGGLQGQQQQYAPPPAVCKGSMDEMMADLSHIVQQQPSEQLLYDYSSIYVYGQEEATRTTSLPTHRDKSYYQAAQFALTVRETILRETGFTTTMGVSVNPLLAKLASGLRKPHTVNLLLLLAEEEKGSTFVADTPLRQIPGVGHAARHALAPCLQAAWQRYHSNAPVPKVWTCRYVRR